MINTLFTMKSFFVRKSLPKLTERAAKKPKIAQDEEITSEEDENEESQSDPDDDQESDTEQQARIKLAKEFLSRIKQDEELPDEREPERLELREDASLTVIHERTKGLNSPLTSMTVLDEVVYTGTKAGVIQKWSDPVVRKRLSGCVTGMCNNGTVIAVIADVMVLFDAELNQVGKLSSCRDASAICMTPFGVFTGHADRVVKCWSVDDRCFVESLFGHTCPPVGVCSGNGVFDLFSCSGFDSVVRGWKINTESQVLFNAPGMFVYVVCSVFNGVVCGGYELSYFVNNRKKPVTVVKAPHGFDSNGVAKLVTAVGAAKDLVFTGSYQSNVNVYRIDRGLSKVKEIYVDGVVVQVFSTPTRVLFGVSSEVKDGRWVVCRNKSKVLCYTL